MYSLEPPKPAKGPSPTLNTLHEVEIILRKAAATDDGPLSLAEIARRMAAKSVRHRTVRTCVDELKRLDLVTEDPRRGVLWTLHEDPRFWERTDLKEL
jgi:Mn-dependent DtxR family transcriptional regulator